MFEISGIFTSTGGGQKHNLTWTVSYNGEKSEIKTSLYTNGGYGYPFSFRKDLIMVGNGKLNVTVSHDSNLSFNISSGIVSLSPMIKTNW